MASAMQPAALGNLGPQKHDNGGCVSATGGDGGGVERGKSGNSAKGTNACASPSRCIQGNAQSIAVKEFSGASSDHADNLEIKAKSEIRQFTARGPGDKPARGKSQTSHQGENIQPVQGQTSQPEQERAAQPAQEQTSKPTQEQIPQSPEPQIPQTTEGEKPPAKGQKRRIPATTATSATTAGPRR